MMDVCEVGAFEVAYDGRTVWVNGKGNCLGRFSKSGIDVHKGAEEVAKTGRECFFCSHGQTDRSSWLAFKAKMLEHHGVEVPEAS